MSNENKPGPQLEILLQQLAGEGLSSAQWQELNHLLLTSAEARRDYLRFQYLNARLATLAWEPAQHSPFPVASAADPTSEPADAELQQLIEKFHALEATSVSTLTRSTVSGPALAAGDVPPSIHIPHSTLHISRLALAAVVVLAIGLLAYTFWPGPKQFSVNPPAAKIASLTDAKWAGVSSQAGDTLTAGQQLLLQTGSAEITFNSQARVIVIGPAELTIVDAGACRLATGKLTAQIPDPAKGFKVHTPSGTVTDLGTEFGVHVRNEAAGVRLEEVGEAEQQPGGGPQFDGTQPPITEVHVFQGKVDVAPGDQLAQAPTQPNPAPPSTILSTGQAAVLTTNEIKRLPAADPFRFRTDLLNGRPRHVLLSEDFEGNELGMPRKVDPSRADDALGAWIVKSGTRKGQGLALIDVEQRTAELPELGIAAPVFSPAAPVGQRVVEMNSSYMNPKHTYPLLIREIDGRLFAGRGKVLVEFDVFPTTPNPELSLDFVRAVKTEATDTERTGMALWQNADPAGPKVAWPAHRWQRVRVLLDVVDSKVQGASVEHSLWNGAEGWVRDLTYTPPLPKFDASAPPRYAVFGFPVPPTSASGGNCWLDNIRIEVISEK